MAGCDENGARRRNAPNKRSCLQECPKGIVTTVSGQLPSWLKGTLLRNGPGLNKIGDTEYNQVLDGMAMIQQFEMDGSKNSVTYKNRFVRSDTYKANTAANRIVVSELGTRAHPDPCKSLLQRLLFYYKTPNSDNTVVSLLNMGDEVYAITELTKVWRVDPETLETKNQVDMSNFIAVNTITVHSHTDEKEGFIYNLGSRHGRHSVNCVVKMPLKDGLMDALQESEILATIPMKNGLAPNYFHSFGITENYVIFIEQPLIIDVLSIPWNFIKGEPLASSLKWDTKEKKTRFILIERKTGRTVQTDYFTDVFCYFHVINSYEADGQVIVDICCYEDGKVIERLYGDLFDENGKEVKSDHELIFQSEGRRYFLPLDPDQELDKTLRAVFCEHETLTSRGFTTAEYPKINDAYDGKKYEYFYGVSRREKDNLTQLIKVNCDTKEVKLWFEDDLYPSEPIFVANPNGANEDDGVIVSAVVHETIETQGFLLVLDAKTFTELARANFECPSAIPLTIHGLFRGAN